MQHDFQADIDSIQRINAVPQILEVVCRATGMGFAAVARVTEARWICCAVRDNINFGLIPGSELQVQTTICHEIRQSGHAVVIDHVSEDKVFADHRTPAMYGFQSYISVPIFKADGSLFGTLCAIDPRPARLSTPETIGMFKLFAELIGTHLDALDRIAASEASLTEERHTAELREQFIAVLGHDLRNPLASISAGLRLLSKPRGETETGKLLGMMQDSLTRMAGMINNVLDLARGRLAGGLSIERQSVEIESALRQVVAELQAGFPDRAIQTDFALTRPVNCDSGRIAQVLSNLLGNALTHGASDRPVAIHATTRDDAFELTVVNSGDPIPPEKLDRLFQPFFRGNVKTPKQGLGLGLYIASEITRAHGGTLVATSNAAETRVTCRIPLQP
ncbi:MAG TPA: GAF domain-containing sensor histidine kinase [Xanthobacteraceae bacterium]|jgi:signal transduction histidine kinase